MQERHTRTVSFGKRWQKDHEKSKYPKFCNNLGYLVLNIMAFFTSAIGTLQTLVVALGAGLCVWGAINLLEGYGNDNPGAKSQGIKHVIPN